MTNDAMTNDAMTNGEALRARGKTLAARELVIGHWSLVIFP